LTLNTREKGTNEMDQKTSLHLLINHHARRAKSAKSAEAVEAYRAARRAMLQAQAELWKLRESEAAK